MYFSDFLRRAQIGAEQVRCLRHLPSCRFAALRQSVPAFQQQEAKYRALHDRMIEYLRFLKEKSTSVVTENSVRVENAEVPSIREILVVVVSR
jgi:hypothetical protein